MSTLTLDEALNETRTGDIWLFRGGSSINAAIFVISDHAVVSIVW